MKLSRQDGGTSSKNGPNAWPVLAWRNVRILPVLHGVMELAAEVRRVMLAHRFDHVAVELPSTIAEPVLRAVRRLPLLSVVHYPRSKNASSSSSDSDPEEDRWIYLLTEPTCGLMEAIRTGLEQKRTIHFIDCDIEDPREIPTLLPDPYAVLRVGAQAYLDQCLRWTRTGPPEDPKDPDGLRERTMAYHLQRIAGLAGPDALVLAVCGLAHARSVLRLLEQDLVQPLVRVRRFGVMVSHLSRESASQVAQEPHFIRRAYESFREGLLSDPTLAAPDRYECLAGLLLEARNEYAEKTSELIDTKRLGLGVRFARNWAMLEGRLAPDLYQIVVAARGIADDDLARTVWTLATDDPSLDHATDLGVMDLSLEDLNRSSRLIRFRGRHRQRKRCFQRLVRARPKETRPGEWKEGFHPEAICSYPPEDIVVESYGAFLRKKARAILSEEMFRVEPFTASLGDGIDIRQTIRNWHEGRIYVKHHQAVRGEVGAVIMIFDPDLESKERFPWKVTWQGEHDQESDMAFYATNTGERMDGPGIARCEYGGFLMTYPPGRMFDVWEDPYLAASSKPERLVLAALDYCLDRMIVYVADDSPSERLKELARRFGKKLVYLPRGQLSNAALKKIRFFHVLSGRHVREYARDYLE